MRSGLKIENLENYIKNKKKFKKKKLKRIIEFISFK